MKINEYIEEALQDLVQARTYITTNSIVVARRAERNVDKGNQFVEVESEGTERMSNNHDLYTCELNLRSVTKIQEDMNGVDLDALYADIADFISNDLTVANLQTAIDAINASSGITVAGFDYPASEMLDMDQYEYKEQRITIALTFTP